MFTDRFIRWNHVATTELVQAPFSLYFLKSVLKMRQSDNVTRGFTLAEILIVMAIIGVLTAILLPVIIGIKEAGRRTVCQSNLKQVGMALMQYVSDNDEVFPPSVADPGAGWAEQCYPYTKSINLFKCPDDQTQELVLAGGGPPLEPVSYGMNSNLGGFVYNPSKPHNVAGLPMIAAPSQTVLLFELSNSITTLPGIDYPYPGRSAAGNGDQGCGLSGAATYPCADGLPNTVPDDRYATGNIGNRKLNGTEGSLPRHNKGSNYLACDGHVKWLPPTSVSGGENAMRSTDAQDTLPDHSAGTDNTSFVLTFSAI